MNTNKCIFDAMDSVETRILPLLSELLESAIACNRSASKGARQPTSPLKSFYALFAPQISVASYLDRIFDMSRCSPSCLIVAMVYIERLILKHSSLVLTNMNAHRIVVVAVLLATKFLEDKVYDNEYWGTIAGLPVSELNRLELLFLNAIEWELSVNTDVFEHYFWGLLSTDECAAATTEPLAPRPAADNCVKYMDDDQTSDADDCDGVLEVTDGCCPAETAAAPLTPSCKTVAVRPRRRSCPDLQAYSLSWTPSSEPIKMPRVPCC